MALKRVMVSKSLRNASPMSVSLIGILALGLCGWGTQVLAQEKEIPLFLKASQTVERDSNLLKDNARKSGDTISSTRLQIGLDEAHGRQRYRADATFAKNKYSKFSQFDNDSYVTSGGFISDIGSNLRLSLNANASRELPSFQDSNTNRQKRNILRNQSHGADLRYGLHGRFSVNAGANRSSLKFDQTVADNRDSHSMFAGVRYLPNDLMYLGVTYTKTHTDYPQRFVFFQVGPSSFDDRTGEEVNRDNLSLNGNWQVTGFSQFSGSVGYSRERYTYDKRRNFNGVTGGASWRLTPSGKMSYSLGWTRDTNNAGGSTLVFVTGGVIGGTLEANTGFQAVNRVSNTYSASADYAATSKISLNASYSFIRYEEESRSVIEGVTSSSAKGGRYKGLTLGADYQPLDSLGLGCRVQMYDRTRSQFSVAFDGQSVNCYAAFTLR